MQEFNVYTFNCEDQYFIYDIGTGAILKSNEIINSILDLSKNKDKNQILSILSNKYSQDTIKEGFSNLNELRDKGYFLYEKENIQIEPSLDRDIPSHKTQNIILALSYKCNLNCIYCYAQGGNFGHHESLMTKDVAKKCIDFWYERLDEEVKNVKATFYGGEALMNKPVLKYCIEYLGELAKKKNKNLRYSIITNGTLIDDEIIEIFKKYKFSVYISIDGGEKIQNENRPFVSQKGSFQIVKNSIKKMVENNIDPTAKITLLHKDVPYLKDTVKELWDLGLKYVGYSPVLIDNEELQITENDVEILSEQFEELRKIQYENLINNKKRLVTNFMDELVNLKYNYSKKYSRCSYFDIKTLIFTPEEEIYTCDKLIGEKEHCLGSIDEGINWDKIMKNKRKYFELSKNCINCFDKRICGFGCFLEKYRYREYGKVLCKVRISQLKATLKLYTTLLMYDENFIINLFERSR